MFYRVIGKVVDGDVNFQFICFPNNTQTQKMCVLFSYVGLSCRQLWMLFM